jgi:hypothetical protein
MVVNRRYMPTRTIAGIVILNVRRSNTAIEDFAHTIPNSPFFHPFVELFPGTVFAIESPYEEVPVTIDIKPGSCPNAFNRKDKGALPVAIVGNSGFDVATINTTKPITLNGVAATRWALSDTATPYTGTTPCGCNKLAGDGYMDFVVQFPVKDIRASLPAAQVNDYLTLTLDATLKSGETIEASDCIKIVK